MTVVIGVLVSFTVPLVAAAIAAIYFWWRSRWELKQLNNPERLAENQKAAERRRRIELMRDIQWWGLQEETSLSLEMIEMLAEQLTELSGPVQSHESGGNTPPKPEQAAEPNFGIVVKSILANPGYHTGKGLAELLNQWHDAYLRVEKLEMTLPDPQRRSIGQQGKLDGMQTRLSALEQQIREAERSVRG